MPEAHLYGRWVNSVSPAVAGPPVAINQYEEIWTEYIIPGDTSFSLNAVVDDGNVNGFCLSAGFVYDGLISGCEYMQTILNNTPTPFSLMFPQQFFTSFGVMVPAPYTDQPFFYQDLHATISSRGLSRSQREPERLDRGSACLQSREAATADAPEQRGRDLPFGDPKGGGENTAGSAGPAHRDPAREDHPGDRDRNADHDHRGDHVRHTNHDHAGDDDHGCDADDHAGDDDHGRDGDHGAQPANVVPPPPGPIRPPRRSSSACSSTPMCRTLIESLNQYGLPNLLTLSNEAPTNDNGMIDGMELDAIHEMFGDFREINPGIRLRQGGGVRNRVRGHQLPEYLPSNSGELYLYYNASMGPGEAGQTFYDTRTQSPTWSGDAYLGSLNYEPQVSGSDYYRISSITGPTVFEAVYQPDTTFVPPVTFPHEKNIDFSFAGAYSIYNWELFFLPHPDLDRDPAQPEPAVPGCTIVVSLCIQPHD